LFQDAACFPSSEKRRACLGRDFTAIGACVGQAILRGFGQRTNPIGCAIDQRNASPAFKFWNGAQPVGNALRVTCVARDTRVRDAQRCGGCPHQISSGVINVPVEIGLIFERVFVDVPSARSHKTIQLCGGLRRQSLGQRGRHLMTAHWPALGNLFQRVAPPL